LFTVRFFLVILTFPPVVSMPMTQHQLVRKLGVSRGTLHRVLTNSPLVKTTTRDRILKQLESLDYTPNAIARGLKTKRTMTIGIIGPATIRTANIEKINALYVAARDRGYHIQLGYSDGSPQADELCIRDLRSRMVDGMVVLGRGMADNIPQYQILLKAHVPFVTLYPIPGLRADCVYVDTKKAFSDLVMHLAGLGHRDIAILLDASVSQYSRNREAGFRSGMRRAGIPVREEWVIRSLEETGIKVWTPEKTDYELGFQAATRLFASSHIPTAVVCFSDEFAIGTLKAAALAGLDVPSRLAIVGYDDNIAAAYARVPLTTMRQPVELLASRVIDLLVDRIDNNDSPPPARMALPATLVIRDSCGSR
jgi:DNA-binding LacI/PurR family transcriptional regulator